MSGHSKWASIKHKKGAADAKRGIIFTKMAKNITVAVKEGGGDGNPDSNFKLRVAIQAAKAANVPNDNIDRAIKRGTGEIEGGVIEEVLYEGMGPQNIPVIVKVLTDNRNRAAASIKHLFTKYGGQLGSSVKWQFDFKGVIRIDKENLGNKKLEDIELEIIDLGAEDIKETDDAIIIICDTSNLQKINDGLSGMEIEADSVQPEYVPKDPIEADEALQKKLEPFFEALDDDEDVDDYYTNLAE